DLLEFMNADMYPGRFFKWTVRSLEKAKHLRFRYSHIEVVEGAFCRSLEIRVRILHAAFRFCISRWSSLLARRSRTRARQRPNIFPTTPAAITNASASPICHHLVARIPPFCIKRKVSVPAAAKSRQSALAVQPHSL